MQIKLNFVLISCLLILIPPGLAGASDEAPAVTQQQDVAVTGAAASFDQRLPPVIPGESIQHNGRGMRVWSSSGPVPVGQVPQAPGAGQPPVQNIPNVGVIVDQRSDKGRK